MLVLSRKVGEKIYINDDIAVTVVRIDGNRVAIGFEAPGEVRIMRSELMPVEQDFSEEPAFSSMSAYSAAGV
ncbi:MAG: carbon storage regulator CsrA [Pirellulales bacterium]